MEAPRCDLCGGRHWSGQPHKFSEGDEVKVKPARPRGGVSGEAEAIPVEPVVEEAVGKPSKFGEHRYKDREARKAYRREWKRRKRVKGKP